ncbi:regulatory protein [Oikeobacillus pervagus]|uniref:Regulatory protein RecX n=1 Tax=Oikeobacillus pervagus TaxID=1325931 RepID=A0AAJ1WJX6_9BACI|nr:recombination regulator RecX [Oikeobacillus pervagus]MDQ0215983.1 regulatory protein [Oikeobacillus pervagus]
MPIITKISVQQKNKERYNIFLNDEYAFSVDEAVLTRFQLKKGKDVSHHEIQEFQIADDLRKSVNKAIHYLSRRMRSEQEVRNYLRKIEVEEAIIQAVIDRLYELNYLNDDEFTEAYVKTQMNTTDKGTELITKELKEKGIQDDLIDKHLSIFPEELQLEKAEKIVQKIALKNRNESAVQIKKKAEQSLRRKGYSWGVITQIKVETKEDDWEVLLYQLEKAKRKYTRFSGFELEMKIKQYLYRKGFSFDQIEKGIRFIRNTEGD